MAGAGGLEPPTSGFVDRRSDPTELRTLVPGGWDRTTDASAFNAPLYRLSYPRHIGGGTGRVRTADTRIFSPLLYQLSYRPATDDLTMPDFDLAVNNKNQNKIMKSIS